MEFWNKSYDEIFLSMAGLADIWEGPSDGAGFGYEDGTSTILAIKIFNDKIFIAQGGGLQTIIKVLSPNGVEIYDLGTQLNLLTHTAQDVYGCMAVINDHELVLGYMYINLQMLFMAPYGIDMNGLWRNPAAKIVPIRIGTSSWVVAIRDNLYWRFFVSKKESPEDCLPCASKRKAARDSSSFECREERYGRHALVITGYKASRAALGDGGASLSVTRMGGFSKMEKKQKPVADNKKCLEAIDQYVSIFNKAKISPSDVGETGQKLTANCSRIMYLSMLQIVEYKNQTIAMYNQYVKDTLLGIADNTALYNKSKNLVQLISAMLSEIKGTSRDSELLKSIFSDQIWWGPIWFIANPSKLVNGINAYTLLHNIKYDDFTEVMMMATASSSGGIETEPLPMGWVIMANKNKTPVKYGKSSMTYFRFPFSICTSTRPLFKVTNTDFRSVCEVETRSDGMLIWTWVDTSTLWNKQYMILRCYKITNDEVVSILAEEEIGYSLSPVDDSAKAVGIGDDGTYWIVRDYYIKDSINGGIGFVESKVHISEDMRGIYSASASFYYSNVNEMSGIESSSISTMKYRDGSLEKHWEKFDLDDDKIKTPAWGNNGRQYSFVSGYTGYQIHVSGEL